MAKSGQCRTTRRKDHRRFDHPRDGTPKIGEEFQERIGLLFFNLVRPILGQPLLRLGLTEAVRRRPQFFLHFRHGKGFQIVLRIGLRSRFRFGSLGLRFFGCLRFRLSFSFRLRLGFSFRLRFGLSFRLRLGSGFIFPNLPLRLLPVLQCWIALADSLLVKFIGTLGDLRRQIGRWLGFDFRLRLSFALRRGFQIVLRIRLRSRLRFGTLGLRFFGCLRFRLSFSFRLRLGFGYIFPSLPLRLLQVFN